MCDRAELLSRQFRAVHKRFGLDAPAAASHCAVRLAWPFAARSSHGGTGFIVLFLPACLRQPLLQLVGQREQAIRSPHDFLLIVFHFTS